MIRFVILATPRTGSNWLCTLLDSHPEVLCHHELFNPEGIHVAFSRRGTGGLDFGTLAERERAPLDILERVWQHPLGHRAVGFKINRDQNALVLRRVLEDKSIRKIVVRRENRLRTFVSERIAESTGEWESYPGLKISAKPASVYVDPNALRQHGIDNDRFYDDAYRILEATAQTAFEVRYEALADPSCQRAILRFLEVSTDAALRGATRRQNPTPLEVLIENYEELRWALRGSGWERDLNAEPATADAGRHGP